MSTLLISHSCFVKHDTGPGHPERPDRMHAITRQLERKEFTHLLREDAPMRDDIEDAIALVHPRELIEAMKEARPSGSDMVQIDGDTVMSAGSWEAVMRAVGAGMRAVDLVVDKQSGINNVFCQVRPPGHHAETRRPMGFCLFNSIAVAAFYARQKHGAERVAVIDFDVHHGNGTQDIFWSDKDMFYASTHQMPLYPGTGALSERGAGNIWNAPLRPNDDGEQFRDAVESRILPALHDFAPDLVMISAGFDAHKDDPLANLRLTEPDYGWVTEALMKVADRHAGGRLVSMLEGGYNLDALGRSVAVHVTKLMGA